MKSSTNLSESANYFNPFLPRVVIAYKMYGFSLSHTFSSPNSFDLCLSNAQINSETKSVQLLSAIINLKISQQTIIVKATINDIVTTVNKWLYL